MIDDFDGIPGPAASDIPDQGPLPWFGWSKPGEMVCASKIQVAWVNARYLPRRYLWWPIVRLLWCSWRGHRIGDKGYLLGSNKRDVWCRHCQKFDQIPFSESDLAILDDHEDWKSGA